MLSGSCESESVPDDDPLNVLRTSAELILAATNIATSIEHSRKSSSTEVVANSSVQDN